MKRWIIITLIICMLGATALAEEPATPSDMPCRHEHTETLCYFDNPAYTRPRSRLRKSTRRWTLS